MAHSVIEVRSRAARCYVYRCTTDQLAEALDHIQDCGDGVITVAHVGGRDWVIVGQKAALDG